MIALYRDVGIDDLMTAITGGGGTQAGHRLFFPTEFDSSSFGLVSFYSVVPSHRVQSLMEMSLLVDVGASVLFPLFSFPFYSFFLGGRGVEGYEAGPVGNARNCELSGTGSLVNEARVFRLRIFLPFLLLFFFFF